VPLNQRHRSAVRIRLRTRWELAVCVDRVKGNRGHDVDVAGGLLRVEDRDWIRDQDVARRLDMVGDR